MRIELFFLKLLLDYVTGTFFEKKALIPEQMKVISKEEAPSLLNCASRCAIRKAEFVYDENVCTCLVYLDDNEKTGGNGGTLSGTFYQRTNIKKIEALKWSIGANRTKADVAKEQYPAQNAIDGDTNTFTKLKVPPDKFGSIWYGRLQKLSTVEYITLHLPNATEYPNHDGGSKGAGLRIFTSVNAHYSGPWDLCVSTGPVIESPLTIRCDAGATNAITIKIRNQRSMILNEVEVYGSEV